METSTSESRVQKLITELLKKHNISIEKWGKDEHKTIGHLIREIEDGEAGLVEESGELFRDSMAIGLDVFYVDKCGNRLVLKEEKQIFDDGRERRRSLSTSLGEKIRAGEDKGAAARRALREELGINPKDEITFIKTKKTLKESQSYPGLVTRRVLYLYEYQVDENDFRLQGYAEYEGGKTTYFVWTK